MSILATLAQFAVANNNARPANATPAYELSIEEARAAVKVINGAKDQSPEATKQLSLRLSRRKLSLDPISKGATIINATTENEAEFTEALLAEVADGTFDAQIVETQILLREAAEAPKAVKVVSEAVVSDDVDLGALDAAEDGLLDDELTDEL